MTLSRVDRWGRAHTHRQSGLARQMEWIPDLPRAKSDYPSCSDSAESGVGTRIRASENIDEPIDSRNTTEDNKFTSQDSPEESIAVNQEETGQRYLAAPQAIESPKVPSSAEVVTTPSPSVASSQPSFDPASTPTTKLPTDHNHNLEMAGRGRGGGAPGQLKNVTWEQDKDIKLNFKPSELFPVSLSCSSFRSSSTQPSKLTTLSRADPSQSQGSPPCQRARTTSGQTLQVRSQPHSSWPSLHPTHQATRRWCPTQDLQRGAIQCAIHNRQQG